MVWSPHKFKHMTQNWILISNFDWTLSELYLLIYIYIYILQIKKENLLEQVWLKILWVFLGSAYFAEIENFLLKVL